MFCTECGNTISPGTKFCTGCGAKINWVDQEEIAPLNESESGDTIMDTTSEMGEEVFNEVESDTTAMIPAGEDASGEEESEYAEEEAADEGYAAEPEESEDAGYEDTEPQQEEPVTETGLMPYTGDAEEEEEEEEEPKKGGKILKIAAGVILAGCVIAGGTFGAMKLLGGRSSSGSKLVYLDGKKYQLVKQIKGEKTESIEMKKFDVDYAPYASMVRFSDDGKYVYFFTKYDDDSYCATLNRAEYAKLKKDSAKNDKYIETIDNDVNIYSLRLIGDNECIYKTGNDNLYYYDGKECQSVKKGVSQAWADEKGNIVFSVYNDGDSNLYGTSTKDVSDTSKLISNFNNIVAVNGKDLSNILVSKEEDDYTYSLYNVGIAKEAEKIASHASIISTYYDDGTPVVYFSDANGQSLNLSNYVVDDCMDADQKVKEPDLYNNKDYIIPVYSYYKITNSYTDVSSVELYTSISENCAWLSSGSWYTSYYSMDYAAQYGWGSNPTLKAAFESFISKYEGQANKDGYIQVTDAVKADLKKLNSLDSSKTANDWLTFCFTRYKYSDTYDYDKYYADYGLYEEAMKRNELRKELQSSDKVYTTQTIYCYKNGEVTSVAENVCGIETMDGTSTAIAYATVDQLDVSLNIKEISSADSVIVALNSIADNTGCYIIPAGSTSPCFISEKGMEELWELLDDVSGDIADIYVIGHSMYVQTSDSNLWVGEITDAKVDSFKEFSDTAYITHVDGDVFYYREGEYSTSSGTYSDLHKYEKGKDTCIAKDVLYSSARTYDDGMVIAYTDYRKSYGYEMTFINAKGEKVMSADDVTNYWRMNSSALLYIADEDLYVFDGKNKTKIANNVTWVWPDEVMDSVSHQ